VGQLLSLLGFDQFPAGYTPGAMQHSLSRCLVAIVILLSGCRGLRDDRPVYRDPARSIEARVNDLLSRMTLEEKVAQIHCIWPMAANKSRHGQGILDKDGNFNAGAAPSVLPHGIGEVARPSEAKTIVEGIRYINAIQKYLVEGTRLGIPAMIHEEGLHGHMAPGATSFPQAIALSCSWDTDLLERVFTATAKEMRARGAHHALTPVLDVSRDPRWGRVEETYGEDPYLISRLGVACIRGFQGRDATPDHMSRDRVIATIKHFAAHGQPQGGTNCAPANFSERTIRSVFLPPFEAAVKEAGVLSVMASYNEVDGVPLHANQHLLGEILRDEWDFAGFVVSDYYGVEQLKSLHRIVSDSATAARRALSVGVDIELPDPQCYPSLVEAVRSGRVPRAQLDRSVRRILRAKFASGCFDQPFVDARRATTVINSQRHRRLALEAARKSIVLLKNNGALPLDENTVKTIAVVGPNAHRVMLGGYTDPDGPGRAITTLAGIQTRCGDAIEVLHAEGCRLTPPGTDWWENDVVLTPHADDTPRIGKAIEAARKADLSILVLGGNEATCREAWADYHLGDRDDLDLLGRQQELFDAIAKLGKPVIVVLIGGRPHTINKIAQDADAILHAWYPGQEGGTALAEILFGDVSPSGKLSITFPRSVGQIPAHYGQKPSARRGYLFADKTPLFPFGHGLSYTQFDYFGMFLRQPKIRTGDSTEVVIRLENAGERAGTEIVQMYIRDQVSTVTRPVLELRGFRRITLEPGEIKEARFPITPEILAGIGLDNRRVVEPGEFEIFIGPSSTQLEAVTLTVTK
jgi:beta-glucosidase-like glycosyl hydrolase